MANEITLGPTVDALEEVIRQLRAVERKTRGPKKQGLKLKIEKLKLLEKVIIFECGKAYPVLPIAKKP
jgi:hypothetical protein